MSWLVILFSIFFLILVFFIFFVLINIGKEQIEQRVTTEVQENQIHINLLNFLRTPAEENETVADYIAYAMMEEIEEEKKDTNMEYNLPSSYGMALDLYNKILLEFYRPDCISLRLEYIDPYGEVLRTRYLGQCGSLDPYSSFVTIPLKEPGNLINITATSGKASALASLQFCLYLVVDEWRCAPYLASSGLGGMPCEGVVFDEISICQEKAEQYNNEEDSADITPGDILTDIYEEGGALEGWVLCEYFDGFYSQCRCEELTNMAQVCPYSYIQIGQGSYKTEQECDDYAKNLLKQDLEADTYPQRCYNYYSKI